MSKKFLCDLVIDNFIKKLLVLKMAIQDDIKAEESAIDLYNTHIGLFKRLFYLEDYDTFFYRNFKDSYIDYNSGKKIYQKILSIISEDSEHKKQQLASIVHIKNEEIEHKNEFIEIVNEIDNIINNILKIKT